MKKRIGSFLLVFMALMTVCIPTTMAGDDTNIQPYYIGIAQVTVALEIDTTTLGDLAESYGFVRVYDGYTADVTLSLQRSKDKTDWSTIKSWEASGTEEIEIIKDYFVLDGYYYRVNILVYVYYPSGGMAEIVSKYSPIQP